MSKMFIIYFKDLMEMGRDKRSILRLFLLPGIFIPLFGHFFMAFADDTQDKIKEGQINYSIVGAQHLPQIRSIYPEDDGFVEVPLGSEDEIKGAIQSGAISFAVLVPNDSKKKLNKGERVYISLYYNGAASGSELVRSRAQKPLTEFNERQRDWRLVFLGVTGSDAKAKLLNPVAINPVDVASTRESVGHNLGSIISYLVFMVCFMGCMFTAIELAAGEKEKGTLEILLMSPIPRYQLILGKFFVVFTLGIMYATFAVISISLWLIYEGMSATDAFSGFLTTLDTSDLILVWLMLIPVTALFSSVVLTISVYAKNHREASSLTGIANIVVIGIVMVIFIPGVNLDWTWEMVPVANVAMAIRELIKGTLTDYFMLLRVLFYIVIIASCLLYFCCKWFGKESVIHRM